MTRFKSLRVSPQQLRCDVTLVTGQSFFWKESGSLQWTGVIENSIFCLKQTKKDTLFKIIKTDLADQQAEQLLRDYLHLDYDLEALYKGWSKNDKHFRKISLLFPGIRLLRQPPLECLYSFICSTNNNIPRITKMLKVLKETYGNFLGEFDGEKYYSFPTLEQMRDIDEQFLRKEAFGYRAKFLVRTTAQLLEKEPGWLMNLRGQDRHDIQDSLCELTGVGRKVADCVALMCLDCLDVVPVDTHVFQIAMRDYSSRFHPTPAKSLTKTVYNEVGDFFRSIHGDKAGWAHSILFCADLHQFKDRLDDATLKKRKRAEDKQKRKKKKTK